MVIKNYIVVLNCHDKKRSTVFHYFFCSQKPKIFRDSEKIVYLKIALRNGHFYAMRCVEALGLKKAEEGVVRISLVHYNTEDEVNPLIEGLTLINGR